MKPRRGGGQGARAATLPCTTRFSSLLADGTGPRRSLSLKLGDTRVYEPQIRARLGTTSHFCEVVVLKFAMLPQVVEMAAEKQGVLERLDSLHVARGVQEMELALLRPQQVEPASSREPSQFCQPHRANH